MGSQVFGRTSTGAVDNSISGPDGINAVGNLLYVGDVNSIKVVDPGTRQVINTISVGSSGKRADEGCVDAVHGLCMISTPEADTPFATFINTATQAVVAQVNYTALAGPCWCRSWTGPTAPPWPRSTPAAVTSLNTTHRRIVTAAQPAAGRPRARLAPTAPAARPRRVRRCSPSSTRQPVQWSHNFRPATMPTRSRSTARRPRRSCRFPQALLPRVARLAAPSQPDS